MGVQMNNQEKMNQDEISNYVLGFAFNKHRNKVILIRKNKPKWQQGLVNGVGGKIKKDEYPFDAMVREFKEETGVYIDSFVYKFMLRGLDFNMYVFSANSDEIYKCKSTTDEEVIEFNTWEWKKYPIIYNLNWMIPLLLDIDFISAGSILYK